MTDKSHTITSDSNCSANSSDKDDSHEHVEGEYSEKYTTLHEIGKGAFGCVKVGYRNSDKLMVREEFLSCLNTVVSYKNLP